MTDHKEVDSIHMELGRSAYLTVNHGDLAMGEMTDLAKAYAAGYAERDKLASRAATDTGMVMDADSIVNAMVNKFLGWKLPPDFSPDAGISFTAPSWPNSWPIGTNLMSADQAKAMFRHVTPLTWLSKQPASSGEKS